MASVRFICGTQDIHKQLEQQISEFLGMEDTILYPSCFDANGGLFETILSAEDAIISDSLNHASIIDGVRLSKAMRFRYTSNNMTSLEAQLQAADAAGARFKLIATDGVFSMDGVIANLKGVCDLAEQYNAMVMVDDCHATGFVGKHGRGSHEYCDVMGRVDILTGTLGKALGGASGGYTSGKKEVVEWLRQRSRPYLFSNSVAPPIVAAAQKAFAMMADGEELRAALARNTQHFRSRMSAAGFTLSGQGHAIIPVMLGDAQLAATMADKMLEKGVYVVGFSYPVVPKGQARIRTQMSAAHSLEQVDYAIDCFIDVGRELGVIE
jgi:glycine C-acetyltransferase